MFTERETHREIHRQTQTTDRHRAQDTHTNTTQTKTRYGARTQLCTTTATERVMSTVSGVPLHVPCMLVRRTIDRFGRTQTEKRQMDTQTDTQTDGRTDTQTDSDKHTFGHTQMDRHADGQTDGQKDRDTQILTHWRSLRVRVCVCVRVCVYVYVCACVSVYFVCMYVVCRVVPTFVF